MSYKGYDNDDSDALELAQLGAMNQDQEFLNYGGEWVENPFFEPVAEEELDFSDSIAA